MADQRSGLSSTSAATSVIALEAALSAPARVQSLALLEPILTEVPGWDEFMAGMDSVMSLYAAGDMAGGRAWHSPASEVPAGESYSRPPGQTPLTDNEDKAQVNSPVRVLAQHRPAYLLALQYAEPDDATAGFRLRSTRALPAASRTTRWR